MRGPRYQQQHLPTRIERYSGDAELEVRGGDQVKKPTPTTRTDIETRAVVSGVGVVQGKRKNQAELGRIDSQERCKMRCQSE